MSNNKHWQSFGELNNSAAFQKASKDEFQEDLPFVSENESFLDAKAPRRDFLKYLGFSTAAAAIAASCEIPVKKAIPFANKPEDIVPGVANYYATTYVQEGDAVSIVAKVRDGRPIKVEGNDLSPITKGGTSARVQASVLDLYDTARLRFPTIDGKEVTLESVDKAVASSLGTGPVVILTSTINSPTSLEVINQFIAKYPGSRHVQYDAISYSGLLLANEASYGKKAIPSYRFDNAKTIVSIAADFLGTWLNPIEFSKQYATGKRIDEKNPSMSKHIHFETVASLTGSNADDRFLCRPSEIGAVAAALLSAVNGQGVAGILDAKLKSGIEKAAKELVAAKGASLVVCGSNDVNVQIIVNAINDAIQSGGKTIDWSATLNYKGGIDADFAKLVDDMNAGAVGALFIQGANPAYTWYDADKFVAGLKKVKTTVSFNSRNDETTASCKFVIPDNHFLESWGDAEPKSGYYSLMQPTIHPLFKTRQWQDSLLKWSGITTTYLDLVKSYWVAKLGNEVAWDKALQDGVINPATEVMATALPFNAATLSGALAAVSAAKKGGKIELSLYQKIAIGAGQGATNPWLQEMPDPITKATWDNYLIVSPALAKTLLDIDLSNGGQSDDYEVHPEKKVVSVTVNNKTVQLPVLIIPGTQPDTVGIAVGYGRSAGNGKTADGVGKNVFQFASLSGGTVSFEIANVDLKLTDDTYTVALTQTHAIYNTDQGNRTEVMKELTLADYKKNPETVREEREEELKPFGGIEKFETQGTIYPYYDRPGIHWGMSVDLNTCTGCGACVVACNAENNVSVVGKSEVARFHDMQWIRIDRYYSGDLDNPKVVFQPLMCQHCDNAPCENVCPVAATNHSTEGLNQMTYNRCIGTRYCANNCPYKVRRFNWADYTGADSFPDNQNQQLVGKLDDVVFVMNDDLSRMVLNPDVTVRSRGVIEKCSFCVQRLQEGKLKAKKASRPLKTGADDEWDLKVACQQSCPTNAIVFGNINDSKSAVVKSRVDNKFREFYSIEQVHTLPNVSYLAKVRNTYDEAEKAEG
ncbi:TAT-variant-translocated molybdopterin oxidoreductase [Limnovirga soli]|uniref:4Fe-4S dicluster domain-containing protein n=1 Tax=Limnovirga soli TaxID=2656915 RepID=A0A8J8FID4_9BACT|nr:TAT-variant-translocated molybdopterin oxidoreductase [Limnovirga soli]NNV56416.1 4Fe-4S dicluster domain-containing protein [Limnovirga soli]